MAKAFLAATVGAFLFCRGGAAAEYFVSPSGSDAATGSRGAPFKTIQRGVETLEPGDTLAITAGEYAESVTVSVKATSRSPVAIVGQEGAWIRPTGKDGILVWQASHVTIAGVKVTGAARAGIIIGQSDHITVKSCISGDNGKWGVQTSLSDQVTIDSCELYGSKTEHGLYFSTTDHPKALDCKIHDNASCGIHMNADASEGGDGIITGATIARNMILDNGARGGAGINMDGVEKSTIERNVLDRNSAGGIVSFKADAARAGRGNKFISNVVRFKSGKGRFGIKLADGSTRSALESNVIAIDSGPAVSVDEASAERFKSSGNFYPSPGGDVTFEWKGKTIDFRAWRQATGQDADSHVAAASERPPAREPPGEDAGEDE